MSDISNVYPLYEKNIIEGTPNKWTRSDVKALSNFEINMLVAHLLYRGQEDINIACDIPTRDTVIVFQGEMSLAAYDFCKIANDAYPVMFKENIGIHKEMKKANTGLGVRPRVATNRWTAMVEAIYKSDDIYVSDENPLRAAMMAYLLKFG